MATRRDAEVWIPWRPQPSRFDAHDAVTAWYKQHGFTVVDVDTHHQTFNLAACRNRAVERAESPVVVISDADTIPEADALDEAIAAARTSGKTHLPYEAGGYRILRDVGTAQFFNGRPLAECDFVSFPFSCSGVYVTTRGAWHDHYGQDELFEGWAPEDMAWRMTHEATLGDVPRHPGRVYALTHEPASKTNAHAGEAGVRYQRYLAAQGDEITIRGLASEYLIARR